MVRPTQPLPVKSNAQYWPIAICNFPVVFVFFDEGETESESSNVDEESDIEDKGEELRFDKALKMYTYMQELSDLQEC